jgi:hypothetical protein
MEENDEEFGFLGQRLGHFFLLLVSLVSSLIYIAALPRAQMRRIIYARSFLCFTFICIAGYAHADSASDDLMAELPPDGLNVIPHFAPCHTSPRISVALDLRHRPPTRVRTFISGDNDDLSLLIRPCIVGYAGRKMIDDPWDAQRDSELLQLGVPDSNASEHTRSLLTPAVVAPFPD